MYAIVIVGGKGERLRPLTDNRPKCMVPLLDKPILEYQLEWLRGSGVDSVVLACGYLHEVIQDYFDDGTKWNMRISYAVEKEPLGRGGAFKLAYQQVPEDEPIVVAANGDNFNSQPLAPMIEQHQKTGATATLLLTQLRSPYGIVKQRGKRITGFEEKPLLPYWLSAGVYIFDAGIFADFPDVGDQEDDVFPRLAAEGRLYGFRSTAYWKGIDTVKDLTEATAQLEAWQAEKK